MKPSFDLNAVKSIIGTHDDLWRWEEAKACYDPEFVKLFSYDYLLSVNDLVCFDSKHLKSSAKAMEAIKNEPVVFALAWYYYYVLYIRAEFDMHQSNPYIPIPRLKTGNAVIDNSFGLCVDLAAVKFARERYQRLGIPECYLKDVLQDFNNWIGYFENRYGTFGFDRENWVMHHLQLTLFRVGRLQFEMRKFGRTAIVFKKKQSDEVIAIANSGILVRADGLIDGTNEVWDPKFMTHVKVTQEGYHGFRLDPRGYITDETVFLPYSDWEIALKPGDNILSIHIPKNGSFAPENLVDSLKAGPDFYNKYLPWYHPKALVSGTWLFEDQLADMLGEQSNIVAFQRMFYRYPERSSDAAFKQFAFFDPDIDFLTVKPKTSLQRKIVELYKNGGKLHTSGGFLLI